LTIVDRRLNSSRVSPVLGFTLALATAGCGRGDAADDILKTQLAEQQIPGAAIVVVKSGQIVKAGGYGLADRERRLTVAADTIFRIQSVSKPFTATAVMMLVEEGKIGLDDPVSRHLDRCPASWARLTVRHLLSQTSGLRDFVNEPAIDLEQPSTDGELMASVASRPLKFEPGESWDYSNTNYLLLGMIIERVSGRWHGDLLAERIFRPLEMTRTSIPRDRANVAGRAQGYTLDRGRIRPSTTEGELAMSVVSYAGGGILSTVLDLAKWDAALGTDRLLRRATREQMWTPVKLNNGTSHPYGFGWELGGTAPHRRVSHAGKWFGFAAQIDRFVDDRLTIVVLTNLAESAPARISRAVAGTLIPALATPVYEPIADTEPAVTERLADVLRRTSAGGLRAEDFAQTTWPYVAPLVDQMKRDFGKFGPLQTLTLVERTENGGDRSYRYRARFSRTTMIFHFVLTRDDRIATMMPELANQ
jgi:CubicO group peptidase (beta-lactamase class C family)